MLHNNFAISKQTATGYTGLLHNNHRLQYKFNITSFPKPSEKMRSKVIGPMRWVKYLMFFFNFLFWLSGVALVVIGGLGELLYGDYKNITQTGFSSATAILMCVGSVIGLFGFAGCYGAIRENYFTLKLFSYLLILLLIAEIALGLWLYFAHFSVGKFLQDFLNNILSKYEDDKEIQELIDKVQRKYDCCGSNSYKDWFNSEWNVQHQNKSRHYWVNNVPRSCCLSNTTGDPSCGNDLDTPEKPAYMFIHTEGCLRLKEFFSRHLYFMITLGSGVMTIHVLAILFTCCLRRAIKHSYMLEQVDRIQLI